MLPYLGPEIIAVMQAACSSSPNDSRSDHRFHSGDGARLNALKDDDVLFIISFRGVFRSVSRIAD